MIIYNIYFYILKLLWSEKIIKSTDKINKEEFIMKRKIDTTEYAGKIMSALNRGVLLTAAAEGRTNSMTISWGMMGFEWGKPIFVTFVRNSRFTKQLLDKNGEFTINMPTGEFDKNILGVCGSKSGRDIDKIKELGLTLVESENISVPAIKELPLTLECKVKYIQPQDQSLLAPEDIKAFYPTGSNGAQDSHIAYYGEIVDAYIIE